MHIYIYTMHTYICTYTRTITLKYNKTFKKEKNYKSDNNTYKIQSDYCSLSHTHAHKPYSRTHTQ